jgi:hypothetical protein
MNKDLSDQQVFATLKRLERLADLTDSRFRIPFTDIRFGLDAVIGLIPFVGDSISLVVSLYLLFEASKLGVPPSLKIKMLRNVLIDWVIGLIPILGDAVDVVFKANMRNMKLLVEHINNDYQSRSISPEPEKINNATKLVFILVAVLLVSISIYVALMYSGVSV